MAHLNDFSAAGIDVTLERVVCDEPVVVGVTTYYVGRLLHACGRQVGSDAGAYGAFSDAPGTTRLGVLLAPLPTDTSSVLVEPLQGKVWSTTSRTIWMTYRAHAPRTWNDPQAIWSAEIGVPFVLTAAESITLAALTLGRAYEIGRASVNVRGAAPSADATITLSNGTESVNLTLPADGAWSATLATPLKVSYGQTLTIATSDGKGASDILITLGGL